MIAGALARTEASSSLRWILVGAGLLLAVVIRVPLLPGEGLPGDLGQFVEWANHIANNGLANAYDEDLTFGPVMAAIWGLLGVIDPAIRTVRDGSDPGVNVVMKLPAVLADFGLAAGVAFALRRTPGWAAIGAIAILLHPGTWYISSWWGQYESVYALAALVAVLFAIGGRDGLAAAALAVAVLIKPQAVPFLIPFAAWFLARGGVTGLLRAAAVGAGVAFVLWLPFLAAGGPAKYLANIAGYQDGVFSILSVRAWNVWWLLQELGAGGNMVSDSSALLGPITFRHVGYGIAGILALVVAHRIWRDPTPRTLVAGLAATTLIAFCFLTTMHERYAYGALVFLMLLVPDRRVRMLGVAFGVVFTLNLAAAVPALPELGRVIPVGGLPGIAGSIAMVTLTWLAFRETLRQPSNTHVLLPGR